MGCTPPGPLTLWGIMLTRALTQLFTPQRCTAPPPNCAAGHDNLLAMRTACWMPLSASACLGPHAFGHNPPSGFDRGIACRHVAAPIRCGACEQAGSSRGIAPAASAAAVRRSPIASELKAVCAPCPDGPLAGPDSASLKRRPICWHPAHPHSKALGHATGGRLSLPLRGVGAPAGNTGAHGELQQSRTRRAPSRETRKRQLPPQCGALRRLPGRARSDPLATANQDFRRRSTSSP